MTNPFEKVASTASRTAMHSYSTSFTLGTVFLKRKEREAIYAIYGFVRFADEIVDTFHGYNQAQLLADFRNETFEAINRGLSLNPIIHSFQRAVREYHIERELIEAFFKSMALDLREQTYNTAGFDEYVYGSAEVVGLMCLRVFSDGDSAYYQKAKEAARSLGAAFQKVNFLRDLRHDFSVLERSYFPGINPGNMTAGEKRRVEDEIAKDFELALQGIKNLPRQARLGVYLAYVYYQSLFEKLRSLPPERILQQRIRVSNGEKLMLLLRSCCRYYLLGV